VFYRFDLIDIIDDCITYYDLEPITIEQIWTHPSFSPSFW
jgi:hypothetical protein